MKPIPNPRHLQRGIADMALLLLGFGLVYAGFAIYAVSQFLPPASAPDGWIMM